MAEGGIALITVQREACRLLISGHAGYAEAGKDIVCAAVTVLTQTMIQSLEELAEEKIQYDIEPGRVDIKHGNLSGAGRLLVDSFFLGIKMVAQEFPDYVRIA